MAKKKKKKNLESTERNKKIALITAIILCSAAIFVSAGMGIKALDTRAADLIATNDPASTGPNIEINWGRGDSDYIWMPIAERMRIHAKVQAALSGTKPLSWHPLYQASKALADTGWVNGQPTAHWTDNGSIIIDADWRIPAAVVRKADRDYLIDYDANVLPLDYAHDQSNQFIIYNPALPYPGVGNTWNEPEIRDALALLNELKANNLLAQIVGVDLGTKRDHGILKLITNGNARIIFGGGPGRSRPAEMPSQIKIDRLVSLYSKTGRIDAGAYLVDIRGQDITMKRHSD